MRFVALTLLAVAALPPCAFAQAEAPSSPLRSIIEMQLNSHATERPPMPVPGVEATALSRGLGGQASPPSRPAPASAGMAGRGTGLSAETRPAP